MYFKYLVHFCACRVFCIFCVFCTSCAFVYFVHFVYSVYPANIVLVLCTAEALLVGLWSYLQRLDVEWIFAWFVKVAIPPIVGKVQSGSWKKREQRETYAYRYRSRGYHRFILLHNSYPLLRNAHANKGLPLELQVKVLFSIVMGLTHTHRMSRI